MRIDAAPPDQQWKNHGARGDAYRRHSSSDIAPVQSQSQSRRFDPIDPDKRARASTFPRRRIATSHIRIATTQRAATILQLSPPPVDIHPFRRHLRLCFISFASLCQYKARSSQVSSVSASHPLKRTDVSSTHSPPLPQPRCLTTPLKPDVRRHMRQEPLLVATSIAGGIRTS